jgi:hypothetical protein
MRRSRIAVLLAPLALLVACGGSALLLACGGSAPDARYPARETGCPVKAYPGNPVVPVDELGSVRVECVQGRESCERQVMDAVCARGGDVAWGMAENSLTATVLVAHAACLLCAAPASGQRGCNVRVYSNSPLGVENIGPVTATCADDDSRETCMRELEDQVCILGGDTVWQVDGPAPEPDPNTGGTRQRMHGRAAHSK